MNINKKKTAAYTLSSFNYVRGLFDGQNHLSASPSWLQNIAFLCLCVYVYTWYLFNDFAGPFSALFVLIGVYLFFKKSHVALTWTSPIILLFIAAILVQLISWYLATQYHPSWSNSSPKVHRMGIWFKMIPIAIILGGRTDRALLCWFLALLALFSASLINGGGISEWQLGLAGKRVDFGVNNAQHTAMLGGALFLSLIAVLAAGAGLSVSKQCLLYLLMVPILGLTLAVVIFTQTRAVWLGLLVSAPFLLIVMSLTSKQGLRSIIVKSLAVMIVVAIVLFGFQDIFKKRAGSLISSYESVKSIDQMLMKDGGFSLRLSTWKESLIWIDKRPLFGWGGDVEKHVVAAAAERFEKPITFRHLHNSYLETLANYGIAGLMILFLLCLYLIFCAYKAWGAGVMPRPVYLFLIGFLPFWCVINVTESYFYYSSGEYIVAIVGGVILSYYWRHLTERPVLTGGVV